MFPGLPVTSDEALALSLVHALGIIAALCAASPATAQMLTSDQLAVSIGANGEISSLTLAQDAFPTNYVMNASNARTQDTADHAWVGELMFSYRFDQGSWLTASTNQSADVRKIERAAESVSVSYEHSSSMNGVRDFKLVETYAIADGALRWSIDISNTGTRTLEIGDLGLPLPFNEYWAARETIYETRTVYHSFTGQNSSYITVGRPSGVGPKLLMIPDASTGAGFEYMDAWREPEHTGSAWAAGKANWSNGLDVFYVHSNAIESTQRGYLPNTSLMLPPGQSKSYAFKFFKVADDSDLKDRLFSEGLLDVTVVPGMIFAADMTAQFDLHTNKPIGELTPEFPAETKLTAQPSSDPSHHIYALELTHLGPNSIVVHYGNGEKTTLQFYAIESVDAAIARHATFMVEHTRSTDRSDPLYNVFDDWMMDSKSRRGKTGSWGWGDDWGWTHGQFLAEKNAQTPVVSEVQALDDYLAAVWGTQINSSNFGVSDWFCPAGMSSNCLYDRAFAYPHVINTYFSMAKIARLYPALIQYRETADAYLLRSYRILNALYTSHGGDPGTGYMGEQTLPDLIQALQDAGHASEAQYVTGIVSQLYRAFKSSPYPYGSEYNYDNTGEEAVYMAARFNNDMDVLQKVDIKTRACRGHQPVWYYYADPVTLNGENWWQFQYSASLIGYCMDDWLRNFSKTPELDERLSYAAKLANLSAINSGQIDAAPENLGTVAWTYQAMKGKVYMGNAETGTLHNGWRQMSGEADLGLFGALRILSADVAVDPLFGLYGYGCKVTAQGACYSVTPQDGVFKRLNLITEKLHVELERDRYSLAKVSKTKDYLALTLQNQTADAHMTKLTVQGLAPGSHAVSLDGKSMGMLTATADKPSTLMLAIGAEPTHTLAIGTAVGCEVESSGPTASAGTAAAPVAGTGIAANSGGRSGTINTTGGASAPSAVTAGAQATAAAGSPSSSAAAKSGGCSCRMLQGRELPASPFVAALAWLAIASSRRRRHR